MTRYILFFAVLIPLISSAQLKYKFFTEPDSATVYVNGEKNCDAPCIARVYWRQAARDGSMVFSVEAPGYEAWTDTLYEKPKNFDHSYKARLKPMVTKFEFDSLVAPIAFDKIVVKDISEGQEIGEILQDRDFSETIKWHAYYENDFNQVADAFYDMAERAGFANARSELNKESLFESEVKVLPRRPRFLVGVEITEVKVTMKESQYGSMSRGYEVKKLVEVSAKWQVFDRVERKVVEEYVNDGRFHNRNYRRTYDFSLVGAINNACSDFFRNSKLNEVVAESRSNSDSFILASKSEQGAYEINRKAVQKFDGLSSMIQHSSPACVTIITDRGHGSGVVIDPSGLILSAYHVITEANEVDVKFNNGITLGADILVYDDSSDVVLLKVQGKDFEFLSPATGLSASLGLEVVTIGTPSSPDLGQSIAKGIVSGRRLNDDIEHIQLDMAVSPGNSGGPLLSNQGEILGIVQSKIVDEGVEGIGFAIPIQTAFTRLKIDFKK